MRRGITPVVAIALLLGMTVAASGGAYTFISQAQQEAQEDATTSLTTEIADRSLRCDDTNVSITVSNTGDAALNADTATAYLHRDGDLVTTTDIDVTGADVRQPGGVSTLSLPFVLDPGVAYTVELRLPADDVTVESSCQARTTSLAAHWDFDREMPGVVRDVARGNDGTYTEGNDGTLVNFGSGAASGWVTDAQLGGHALAFDGTDDEIEIGSPQDLPLSPPFTFTAWIRPQGLNSDTDTIVRIGDGSGSYEFNTNWQSDELRFYQRSGDIFAANTSMTEGTWYFAALTVDADNDSRIFLDGEVDGTAANLDMAAPPNTMRIGRGTQAGYFWEGTLDDVRVYDRALSAAEISALYDGAAVRSGLVGEWTFDEGSGTTAHDTSMWVDGTVGAYGMDFDGDDDWVNTTYRPRAQTDFSVSYWFRTTSPGGGSSSAGGNPVISNWGSGAEGVITGVPGYVGSETSDGQVTMAIRDESNGDNDNLVTVDSFNDGAWHHAVAVRNYTPSQGAGQMEIYVDGEDVPTTEERSQTADDIGTEPIKIARETWNTNHLNGSLDDIRIYETALTPDQVAALYESGN